MTNSDDELKQLNPTSFQGQQERCGFKCFTNNTTNNNKKKKKQQAKGREKKRRVWMFEAGEISTDMEEQEDELLALQSIFSSEEFVREDLKAAGEIRVSVELSSDFTVAVKEGKILVIVASSLVWIMTRTSRKLNEALCRPSK